MRQVIRLPEPRMRPEVEARGKARADVLRPYPSRYVDPTDIHTAGAPTDLPAPEAR